MDCAWAGVSLQPPEGDAARAEAGWGGGRRAATVEQEFLILIGEEGGGLGGRNQR